MRVRHCILLILFLFVLNGSACTGAVERDPVLRAPTSEPTAMAAATPVPTQEATAVPTQTPTSTPAPAPSPTGVFIYDEPIVFKKLPVVAPLPINLDPSDGLLAYQQDRQLWVDGIAAAGPPQFVTACDPADTVDYCLPQLHWSPAGTGFFYETAVNGATTLTISDLQGNQQAFSLSTRPYRVPVWSPDGRQLILFIGTNRPWGDHTGGDFSGDSYGFLTEVWRLQMDAVGNWGPPERLTELETPGIGCGGGGISVSDRLYDLQDGFALGFQAARQMFWTNADIILYHLSCDGYLSQGYGRYDVRANRPLPPYDGRLHGLVLAPDGRRWYAITGRGEDGDAAAAHRLVTGVVDELEYGVVETAVPVHLLAVGQISGDLYYTSRERIQRHDISGTNPGSPQSPPYFHFYHTQLWTIQPDGDNEQLLWESDDHSYSRLTETPDGDLLFVLIENDLARYEAMTGGVPESEWPDYFPRTQIMRLAQNGSEPEIYIEDARDLTAVIVGPE